MKKKLKEKLKTDIRWFAIAVAGGYYIQEYMELSKSTEFGFLLANYHNLLFNPFVFIITTAVTLILAVYLFITWVFIDYFT